MGMSIVEFSGLVSRRRKSSESKDLVRGIEVGKIADFGKDHGSHAVTNTWNRGNRRMQFVHEFFNFGFYFLNLLGKHADKSNGMFEFQRLCRQDTSNGRNGSIPNLNSFLFLVMPPGRRGQQVCQFCEMSVSNIRSAGKLFQKRVNGT